MSSQITRPVTNDAPISMSSVARNRQWRIGFFTVMPGVIFLIVLAGFTRTLYARPLFHPRPIPPYLYVHGIVLTCWFAWAWTQSLLISAGRIANHRRSGMLGACFAVIVFAAALMATMGLVSGRGLDLNASASSIGIGIKGITVAQFYSGVVWHNVVNALSFALFVAGGVIFRHRPQIHKRLMLFASISLLNPALARIARWPGLGGEQGPFTLIVFLSLAAVVVVYDLYSRKRVEPSTMIAIAWLLIIRNAATFVSHTHLGLSLIYALR